MVDTEPVADGGHISMQDAAYDGGSFSVDVVGSV
jgi:hypothetical protein